MWLRPQRGDHVGIELPALTICFIISATSELPSPSTSFKMRNCHFLWKTLKVSRGDSSSSSWCKLGIFNTWSLGRQVTNVAHVTTWNNVKGRYVTYEGCKHTTYLLFSSSCLAWTSHLMMLPLPLLVPRPQWGDLNNDLVTSKAQSAFVPCSRKQSSWVIVVHVQVA